MAVTMHDISGFAGNVWDREFILSFKKRDSLFSFFRTKMVKPNVKTVNVPVFGGLTANAWTPGGGNTVTLQAGTRSTVEISLDKSYETSVLNDDIEELQSDVEDRTAVIEEMTNALLGQIDTDLLTMLGSYTGIPAAQQFSTTTEVASDASTVATEIERLIMEANAKMDSVMGASTGNRFVIVDSWVYRRLIGGSSKQSPEVQGSNFAYSSGMANPIQGCKIIPASSTSRSYDVDNTRTSIKCYLCLPSAIALGVQKLPALDVTWQGLYKSYLLSADVLYGLKEAVVGGICEMTIKVDGNLFSL